MFTIIFITTTVMSAVVGFMVIREYLAEEAEIQTMLEWHRTEGLH